MTKTIPINYKIKQFTFDMTQQVLDLILDIQTSEFGISITKDLQPDLMNIQNFYQVGNGNFWCAFVEKTIVGTIGLLDIGNKQLALRKMFVRSNQRGTGIAKDLLNTAFAWAKQHGCSEIYLGTTEKFLAAHRFYEKTGFTLISDKQLPKTFPKMTVDTKFYMQNVDSYTFS